MTTKKQTQKPNYDIHLGCAAYPNCDIDPCGCAIKMDEDMEYYGHRDGYRGRRIENENKSK